MRARQSERKAHLLMLAVLVATSAGSVMMNVALGVNGEFGPLGMAMLVILALSITLLLMSPGVGLIRWREQPGVRQLDDDASAIVTHLFEHGAEAIAIFDADWSCKRANRAMTRTFAIQVGSDVSAFRNLFDHDRDFSSLERDLVSVEELHMHAVLSDAGGSSTPSLVHVTKVARQESDDIDYLVLVRDLSEVIQAKENLEFIAKRDPITTAQNAMAFEETVCRLFDNGLDGSKTGCVGVLRVVDLRMITDLYSQEVADIFICNVSHGIQDYLGDYNVGRLSREEFGFILRDVYDDDVSDFMLNKLCKIVSEKRAVLGHDITSEVELGYTCSGDSKGGREMLSNAFVALNNCSVTKRRMLPYKAEMQLQLQQEAEFRAQLLAAVEQKQFQVVFQPQVALNSGQIVGVESLLRWTLPDGQSVPPSRFVPELEKMGLIYDVGLWVLEHCCETGRKWLSEGMPPFQMAVNVSAVQLLNLNFTADIIAVLARTRFPPKLLELEFTESCLIGDPKIAEELMTDMGNLGVKIAIDDFGTGYSSLAYLKRFKNIDKLKIDKSFVDSIDSTGDAVLTDAIIGLAKSLNLRAIAEGVETDGQVAYLSSHHCDEIQGYHISKPLSEAELMSFVKSYSDELIA